MRRIFSIYFDCKKSFAPFFFSILNCYVLYETKIRNHFKVNWNLRIQFS